MDNKFYGVKCSEISRGIFSSERVCFFKSYQGKTDELVDVSVFANECWVEGDVLRVQSLLGTGGGKALVRIVNAEDFDCFYVPRQSLTELTKSPELV